MPGSTSASVDGPQRLVGWRQKLFAGPLRRGFLLLIAGTGAGQALAVGISPVVSRIYTPSDFGVCGVFVGVASVLAVAAALRYDTAVVVPSDDENAAEILAAGCAAVGGLALLCGCVISFSLAFGYVPAFLESVKSLLWLLPISQLGVGWQSLFLNWALRKRAYNRIARAKLWQGVVLVGAQVILGALGSGAIGLVVAFVLSQGAGMTQLARVCWQDDRDLFRRLATSRVWERAIAYWRFPIYSVPASLMNAVGTNVPQIAITVLFGTAVGGAYAFATRVFLIPGSLVAQSLAQMYGAELARALTSPSDRSARLFRRVAVVSTAAGCGITAAAATAPWWFPVLFGSQWHDAATYSRLLAPSFGAIVACSPLFCFHLTGFNVWQLGWDSLRLSFLVAAIWIAGLEYQSAMLTIGLMSALTSVVYVVGLALSWQTIQCAQQVTRRAVATA